MLKIGSHVSMSGKEMLLNSAREAVSYGADTFMVYTGAPQNTRRKPVGEPVSYTHLDVYKRQLLACPEVFPRIHDRPPPRIFSPPVHVPAGPSSPGSQHQHLIIDKV